MEPIFHIVCIFLVGLHHGLSVFGRGMDSRRSSHPLPTSDKNAILGSLQRRVLMGLA